MALLSPEEKQRLVQAIEAAEGKTRGEFVTVIAGAADSYRFIPVLWAALPALLVPLLITLAGVSAWVAHTYEIQFAVFIVLGLLFQWQPVKMRLIPRAVKESRARKLAREQFLAQNLHHTQERTGVLLFVSVAEHYVEIMADKGINDVVAEGYWDQVVADFVAQVKNGRVAEGFLHAVTACGDLLAEHFPVDENDRNELPDRLVEI